MMKKSSIRYLYPLMLIAACVSLFLAACSEDDEVPENPYDSVNYDTDTTTNQTLDPYSIAGLHKNIFSTKCNMPGCHDGTFEPDFRTIQSTYSTLVYQKVNKTMLPDSALFFTFRVIPFDTTYSFLHERVTTTTTEYMPSNGNRLSPAEINQINTWIMNGARDINGNIASAPNNLPGLINNSSHLFYNALDSFTIVPFYLSIVDTNRYQNVPYYPFLVNAGSNLNIIFWTEDDSTAVSNLLVNQCKFSLLQDDFSAAQTVNAAYVNLGAPNEFWMATFPVTWPPGTQVYFRYYMKDTDNPNLVEFPRNEHPFYYKSFFSFLVQ